MRRTKRYATPKAIDTTKKVAAKKYRDTARRERIEQGEIPAPVVKIEKTPEMNPNKVDRSRKYKHKQVHRSTKRVRDQLFQKDYWKIKKEK